ncbi:MAG: DUF2997 domain-containing protein [Proteobacteria bacterium]|nr:DUF2997 domain-containing protein [Pseudomonadota bacterium]
MVAGHKGIKITTAPDGRVSIEAVGYTGLTCARDIGALQELLGLIGGDEALKGEYFEGDLDLHLSQAG